MKKLVLLLFFMVSVAFGRGPEYVILMSETIPKGYEKDVFKKSIVLMTEARLYLQKKYKKKVSFKYQESLVSKKDDILKELKKENARFYVYLKIDKKKSRKNQEKGYYNLVIFDAHSKRSKTIKTKSMIRDKKIVKISQGDIKNSAKKIAKILKKK
ncbi:MAG: hypothetical protein U9O56_00300 [Campylobacterota bacterium]|nr:hypothetical protein [Campylobacterota bacterium]